jgi:hypothetical protein
VRPNGLKFWAGSVAQRVDPDHSHPEWLVILLHAPSLLMHLLPTATLLTTQYLSFVYKLSTPTSPISPMPPFPFHYSRRAHVPDAFSDLPSSPDVPSSSDAMTPLPSRHCHPPNRYSPSLSSLSQLIIRMLSIIRMAACHGRGDCCA